MSRYTKSKTKKERQYQFPVFGGTKSFERRKHLPGIHGPRLRRKKSDFADGLIEKQRVRFMYGPNEKQFYRTFVRAKQMPGVTGEVFLQLLETRLDNIVFTLGFAKSRPAARQFVGHGHVTVNGQKVNIPSYTCKPGDVIAVKEKVSSKQLATMFVEMTQARLVPSWLSVESEALRGTVLRLPTREEMHPEINEQLIVEYYSR